VTDVLERALVDLAIHLDHPTAPDLPARVRARIEDAVAPPGRRPLRIRARVAIAAVAALAVGGVTLGPAIADWLGIDGVRVRQEAPPVTAVGQSLDLGEAVSHDDAEAQVGFDLQVPGRLGDPDELWIDHAALVPIVTLVYRPRPGLPAAELTGAGALLSELRGAVDDRTVIDKFARDARVELVRVNGARALWIEGAHEVAMLAPDGRIVVERVRLAANVLLWERDGITFRLESVLTRDAAIRIAASVR
jgi:hypothetical protein